QVQTLGIRHRCRSLACLAELTDTPGDGGGDLAGASAPVDHDGYRDRPHLAKSLGRTVCHNANGAFFRINAATCLRHLGAVQLRVAESPHQSFVQLAAPGFSLARPPARRVMITPAA